MVMMSPLSCGLASYRDPIAQAQTIVTTLLVGLWPHGHTPAVDSKATPRTAKADQAAPTVQEATATDFRPSYTGTTKVDMMRLFVILSNRRSAVDSCGTWIKSSLSSYNGNCVEVAGLTGDRIRVRDSNDPRGAVLNFTPAEWDAFIGGVHKGEFDRSTGGR
jgi:Domain of unknown function (DUF397)